MSIVVLAVVGTWLVLVAFSGVSMKLFALGNLNATDPRWTS